MKRFSNVPPLKIKMGKGPLSKNGKTPWATGTMYVLTKSKLEGGKVDRETVKRAMDELYRETGQLEYRYRRLKRRASTKSRY